MVGGRRKDVVQERLVNRHRGGKTGVGQGEGGGGYPGWTRCLGALAEPFYRSSAEGRPTEGVGTGWLWEDEWIRDELRPLIFSIVKPFIHEIAQCYPRSLTLIDCLIGQRHRLYASTCFHSVSR